MPTPRLPKTKIRLASSVSFFVLREDAISLETFFASIFSPRNELKDIQRQMRKLDGITSFTEDQSRDAEHRYEVDSNIKGEPLEVFGSPVRRTFKIRRAVLYKDDLIKALGFEEQIKRVGTVDAGLLSNTLRTPFIIIKREIAPEDSGVAPIVTFYRGCLLSSIARSYDASSGGTLAVYEDANIYYAGRQKFTTNS